MKKSIAVIGQGFVGGSLTTVLNERGITVYVHDKTGKVACGGIDTDVELRSRRFFDRKTGESIVSDSNKTPIQNMIRACENVVGFSKIYFVCVPTPMLPSGAADLSIVERVLNELSSVPGDRIAVIKSTVPPGSTESWNKKFEGTGLHVVFNPEFLTEANALDDMRNQNRIVLGGPRPWINSVRQLFQSAFPNVPIIKTSSTTAEMVKYVTNVHLAVKVSLANEFYQICDVLDKRGANVDWDKVVEYSTLDERLGKSHWQVPGPMPDEITGEPAFGFAGSCFIKDLNALMFLAKSLGIDPKTMLGAWEKNLEVRPQRDWEKLIGRAVSDKSDK